MKNKSKVVATLMALVMLISFVTCELDVQAKAVPMISHDNILVKLKGSQQLTVYNVAEDAKIVWSSNHPKIVSVSQTGKITGKKVGKATITAKVESGGANYTFQSKVVVKKYSNKTVTLNKKKKNLGVKDGYYYIRCKNGKYIGCDLKTGELKCTSKKTAWYFENSKNGWYIKDARIDNGGLRENNKAFDISNWWMKDNNKVHIYNQIKQKKAGGQNWKLRYVNKNTVNIVSSVNKKFRLVSGKHFVISSKKKAKNTQFQLISAEKYNYLADVIKTDNCKGKKYASYLQCNYNSTDSLPDLADAVCVDFKTSQKTIGTYYCVLTVRMNVDSLIESGMKNVNEIYSYGGLQSTNDGDQKIHSMWQTEYEDQSGKKHIITPKLIYPKNAGSAFSNEGSGTRYLDSYSWKANNWYRYVFRCWTDANTTYLGSWVQDLSTGKVEKIAVYDTGVKDSYITTKKVNGFLEDYAHEYYYLNRDWTVKNIYARGVNENKWYSLNKVDALNNATNGVNKGSYSFLRSAEGAIFKSCGLGNQQTLGVEDNWAETGKTIELNQPSQPTINLNLFQ